LHADHQVAGAAQGDGGVISPGGVPEPVGRVDGAGLPPPLVSVREVGAAFAQRGVQRLQGGRFLVDAAGAEGGPVEAVPSAQVDRRGAALQPLGDTARFLALVAGGLTEVDGELALLLAVPQGLYAALVEG